MYARAAYSLCIPFVFSKKTQILDPLDPDFFRGALRAPRGSRLGIKRSVSLVSLDPPEISFRNKTNGIRSLSRVSPAGEISFRKGGGFYSPHIHVSETRERPQKSRLGIKRTSLGEGRFSQKSRLGIKRTSLGEGRSGQKSRLGIKQMPPYLSRVSPAPEISFRNKTNGIP